MMSLYKKIKAATLQGEGFAALWSWLEFHGVTLDILREDGETLRIERPSTGDGLWHIAGPGLDVWVGNQIAALGYVRSALGN